MNTTISKAIESVNIFLQNNYYSNVYKSKINKGLKLFYSNKHEYNICFVINASEPMDYQVDLEYLTTKLTSKTDKSVKILKILINDENINTVVYEENMTIVTTTIDKLGENLLPYFAKISALDMNESLNDLNLNEKEQVMMESMSNGDVDPDQINAFKRMLVSIKQNRISFTWVILFMFVITPIVFAIMAMFMNIQLKSAVLIFGGTNQTLSMYGGQLWRIFTYGFAPNMQEQMVISIIFMILFAYAIFNTSRITEILVNNTLRISITFVLSYITIGFFASTVLPNEMTGGYTTILGILIGLLLMNASGDKTPVGKFSQFKSIWPILLIFLFTLIAGNKNDLLMIGSAIIISSCYAGLVKAKFKEWNYTQWIMTIILLAIWAVGITFIVIPFYVPAQDQRIIYTLEKYSNWNIFGGIDGANRVAENLQWDFRWVQNENGKIEITFNFVSRYFVKL